MFHPSSKQGNRSENILILHLTLNTENSEERSVCFSPEKHKLISIIESEKSGCELKKFKKSDPDDILVTDYTSVKKMKLSFEMPTKQEE